jgi:ribA/ribD-fused uncharacterized protein
MAQHYDIQWLTDTVESGASIKYLYFWGHANKYNEETGKFCFSQWYEAPFTMDGITYKTAEHWMMAYKALLFEDHKIFDRIIACRTPAEAKKLGRQVLGFDEIKWNKLRCDIVRLGNIYKFNQHPTFATYLLQTDDKVLVEASPTDTIWGIGLAQDSNYINNIYAWRGLNLLGFALMEARDFLRDFGHFKPLENAMLPPWKKFPGQHPYSMFWRMGAGEEYVINFAKYFYALSDRERMLHELTYPEPFNRRR